MALNNPPLLPPNAPPPAATNAAVKLSLLTPSSPSSPASPRRAEAGNLFHDASEKQLLDLVSMGYSLAKKKGGRHTRGALISSRDTILLANNVSSDNSDNEDYSPTPIVHITQPKKRDSKIALNSNFFYSFVRGRSVRKCLPVDILLFTTLRRKWQNSTLVFKSNYRLISMQHPHLARSRC